MQKKERERQKYRQKTEKMDDKEIDMKKVGCVRVREEDRDKIRQKE